MTPYGQLQKLRPCGVCNPFGRHQPLATCKTCRGTGFDLAAILADVEVNQNVIAIWCDGLAVGFYNAGGATIFPSERDEFAEDAPRRIARLLKERREFDDLQPKGPDNAK